MSRPIWFLVAMLLAVSMAGCVSSETVANEEVVWSESALREHLRQLATPIVPADSALVARRTLYAVRRMRAAELMPAREPSFLVRMGGTDVPVSSEAFVGPTQAHVVGYVAGRHPSHYDELILVTADLNSPATAAALEVARALVREARYTQTPERTVLFALWAPPRTGALGLGDFLKNPTWALENVKRVLLVTADSTSAAESRAVLEEREIPAEVVAVPDRSVADPGAQPGIEQARTLARTLRLTDALYARTRAAAVHSPSE